MLNVCHNTPVVINGYSVTDVNYCFVARHTATKETLLFKAEGENGNLRAKPIAYNDGKRTYCAWRFLSRHMDEVRMLAQFLADNNYLWDYGRQEPLLDQQAWRERSTKK